MLSVILMIVKIMHETRIKSKMTHGFRGSFLILVLFFAIVIFCMTWIRHRDSTLPLC